MKIRTKILGVVIALGAVTSLSRCAAPRPDVPRPLHMPSPQSLAGTWHVLASTFPMWLDGGKTDPAFHYAVRRGDDGRALLDDRVTYFEGGRAESIDGVDTPDPHDPSHLTWRGKGVLRLFTSDWYVALRAPDDAWAVIYFSSTIATPEGVDIIARTPSLPEATLEAIHAEIAGNAFLAQRAKGLRPVSRRAR